MAIRRRCRCCYCRRQIESNQNRVSLYAESVYPYFRFQMPYAERYIQNPANVLCTRCYFRIVHSMPRAYFPRDVRMQIQEYMQQRRAQGQGVAQRRPRRSQI